MPKVVRSLLVPFSSTQMYELINNVAAYPEFLPWCKSAVIHSSAATALHATLCIGKGLLSQSISTKNTMIPNEQIAMEYQAGPFKNCTGGWQFISVAPDKCQVEFTMQYEFTNMFHAMTLEPVFTPLANTLIDAFYKRAQELYGNQA